MQHDREPRYINLYRLSFLIYTRYFKELLDVSLHPLIFVYLNVEIEAID